MKSLDISKWRPGAAALFVPAAFFLCSPVSADTLDAKTVGGLVSGHTWQQKRLAGSGFMYWAWSSDGSVCLKNEMAGSCIDTGRWKLDRDSVCWELSWWGKSDGVNSRCVRVAAKGDGRYEMVPVDGVTKIEFTIAK